jgi:hypothetical protein
MDDDEDDREFSKGIVFGFLEQAEQTFDKMDASLYRLSGSFAEHPADLYLVYPATFLNCRLSDISSKVLRQHSASSKSRINANEYSTSAPRRMRQAQAIFKMRITACE